MDLRSQLHTPVALLPAWQPVSTRLTRTWVVLEEKCTELKNLKNTSWVWSVKWVN